MVGNAKRAASATSRSRWPVKSALPAISSAPAPCWARVAKAMSKSRSLPAPTMRICAPRRHLRVSFLRLGSCLGRVDEQTNHCGLRHYLAQELQLLGVQVGAVIEGDAGEITSRPAEACHEADFDWVFAGGEHDGYGRSRHLGCLRVSGAAGYDYGAMAANEISHQCRQSPSLIVRPAVFDRKVPPLSITRFS